MVSTHLKYLRYVVRHKFFVARAGLAINGWSIGWLWRLLVHDLSKFHPREWRPYAVYFYGMGEEVKQRWIASRVEELLDIDERLPFADAVAAATAAWRRYEMDRKADFNRAWLYHQHANDHHWQHWVLREDSGKTILLLPESVVVDEMVADWLGAGPKVLRSHTFAEAVAETIVWYAANHQQMQLRTQVKQRVEATLLALSETYGITDLAQSIEHIAATRASLVIPGR
jgi:hypothetical protein